ncbi:MAG: hypothetical protein EPN68_06480 [Rhodanobacter sp.]|nr:MAG: hypothetical protein EPN68_06480 [Rhodanobacter sp.]
MTDLFATPLSRRLRLAPQTLMPGESISSLVDRQAQLWGIRRKDLVYQMAPIVDGMLAMRDLDACRKGDFLDICAQKTGIEWAELEKHRAARTEPLVRVKERNAYCPICFHEDASAGYTPYFRLDWARIFLTHCRIHGCPLFRWSQISADGTRRLPHKWFMGAGPEMPVLPQFQQDFHLARGYAYGIRPKKLEVRSAWDTVRRFEAWLYDLGAGEPNYRETDGRGHSLEWEVMHRAAELTRDVIKSEYPWEEAVGEMSSEGQRLMSFAFATARPVAERPTWRNMRGAIRSIAARRAMMYRLSMLMTWRHE